MNEHLRRTTGLLEDIRYALRSLRRHPGFSLVAVATLALGIGASVAVFSVLNGVVLEPLAYPDSERLVNVYRVEPPIQRGPVSKPDFLDVRERLEGAMRMAGHERLSVLLTFETFLPGATYPEAADASAVLERLIERIESLPGVTGAAAMSGLPPVREVWGGGFALEGKQEAPGGLEFNVDYFQVVSGDYADTMGIPFVAGRAFTAGDDGTGTPVAIINQRMAETFYPGQNAIGRRIRPIWVEEWFTIVGIAGDVKQAGLSEEISTEIYFHAPQMDLVFPVPSAMHIVVRSSRSPAALADELRRAVWSVDGSLPVAHLQSMETHLAGSVGRARFLALLLTIFGGVALTLAAIGTYGVLSYSVAERKQEIGIRMAMGAKARGVVGMIMRDGFAMAATGLVLGILGSLVLTRLMESLLFSISSTDPMTFVLAPAVLALVAAVASYLPARRATHADPVATLRVE
ncbi:MAG TPA: ABC transporter permease [Woeseiaceae bacterium]|nr:ABC transporter permease [Woeseiaceae bacterium]